MCIRDRNYDALTGLPVYNKFVDKLEAYMAANGKVGLYFVSSDFSNFQYVNEMYGLSLIHIWSGPELSQLWCTASRTWGKKVHLL